MGVGFQLLGRFAQTLTSPDDFLEKIQKWVEEYAADLIPSSRIGFSETEPTLFCLLHPAADELYLSILDLNHLVASTKTSTVGPGYHIFLCDMLRKLGQVFDITWEENNEEYFDEGGYFFSGDQKQVFDEMTKWLGFLCECFFNGTFNEEPGDMPTALCMPTGVTYQADSRATTPLGPRDMQWLKRVSEDGRQGWDFFAWWEPALNAEYFRGRALARMWTEVRWRKPINDAEREVLRYVSQSLETAFKLDATLDFPWPEWAQILEFLEEDSGELEFVRSRSNGLPKIGYRRRNVSVILPGYWILTLPGSFSDFEPDEEGDFSARDSQQTIWFTSYNFVDNPEQMFMDGYQKVLQKGTPLLEKREDFIGGAEVNEKGDDDERYFALTSSNVGKKGHCFLSVIFTDPTERAWAEGVWRSLQTPQAWGIKD